MAYGIFGARRGVGDCMALLNEVSASLRGKGLESHSIPLIQRSLASMQAKVDELAQLLREQFSPAAQVVLFDCEWYADPANFTKIPEATTAEEQKDATA